MDRKIIIGCLMTVISYQAYATVVSDSGDTVQVSSNEDFSTFEEIARWLYSDAVVGSNQDLITIYCTTDLQRRLKAANDANDGYAVWLLRSGSRENTGEFKIVSIKPDGNNAVIVNYIDMGREGATRLIFAKNGPSWEVHDITTADGKPLF